MLKNTTTLKPVIMYCFSGFFSLLSLAALFQSVALISGIFTAGIEYADNTNTKAITLLSAESAAGSPYLHILYIAVIIALVIFLIRIRSGKRLQKMINEAELLSNKLERKEEEEVRLKQELEEVKKLNAMKTEFLARMSHQLRTPMSGILGLTDILQQNLEKGDKEDNVENLVLASSILRSGKGLLQTINSILNLTLLENERIELRMENTEVTFILKHILEEFSPIAEEKGLSLKLNIKQQGLFALVDERYFAQIVNDLINSAINFTHKGTIAIEAEFRMMKAGSRFLLHVKNTGIRLSPDTFPKELGSIRFDDDDNSHTEGLFGLSLSIVTKVTELMGGKIELLTGEQGGTDFTLSFEGSIQDESTLQDLFEDKEISFAVDNEGTKPTVLLVDDSKVIKEVTQFFLKDIAEIDFVTGGNQALKAAESKQYHVILMDIKLQEDINGIEAAKKIKALPQYKNLPIIALTGYALSGDREKILAEGFSHYLPKPFTKFELLKIFSEIFPVPGNNG